MLAPALLAAQNDALFTLPQALEHYGRMVQLMESTTIAVPGLARAAAPVIENVRQSVDTARQSASQNDSSLHYAVLVNARAYMALAEAMPKPHPFPEEGRRQFSELRGAIDRSEAHFRAQLEAVGRQLRNPDRDNLRRYEEANGVIGTPNAGNPRVVFLGDSITDGWRLNEYFPGKDFVNRGISGQVTGQMLGRMMADVIRGKPAAMVVLAGTNDIARGVARQTIQDNLTMITDLAESRKIKVALASVLPIHDYNKDKNPNFEMSKGRPPADIKTLNEWIKAYCQRKGFVYLDYFSAMADERGFLKKELADDGLHPNAEGYRAMAPLAAAAIEKMTLVPVLEPPGKKKRLFPFGRK
jgi:lysophospholipase L1-like esterase